MSEQAIIGPEVRAEITRHMLKHMMSFVAQVALLLSIAVAYVQLGWPLPASQDQVERIDRRIDDLSLVVLYDKKSDILNQIDENLILKTTTAPDRRSPYIAIERHLKQKLEVVDRSIRDLEG